MLGSVLKLFSYAKTIQAILLFVIQWKIKFFIIIIIIMIDGAFAFTVQWS